MNLLIEKDGEVMKKNISKEIIFNYVGTILISILGFLATRYLVVNLEENIFGQFSLLRSFFTLSMMLTSLGLPAIIGRYIPELMNSDKYNSAKKLLIYSYLLKLIFITILFVLYSIYQEPIINFFSGLNNLKQNTFIIYILTILINLNALFKSTLESLILQKELKLSIFINKLVFLLGVTILINKGSTNLKIILYIWTLSELFNFLLGFYYQIKRIFIKKNKVKGVLQKKRIAKYGLYAYFSYSIGIFYNVLFDNFVISHYLGNVKVGMYTFYNSINSYLLKFSPPMILLPIIIPIVISNYTKDYNKEKINFYFQFYLKIVFFLALPMFIFGVIYMEKIIYLVFDSKFITNVFLAQLILIFGFFKFFNYSLDLVWRPLEKSHISTISIIFSIYNLIMDIYLIPIYGVLGAIIATGTAGIFTFVTQFILLKKHIDLVIPFLSLSKFISNSLIFILICLMGRVYTNSILDLLLFGIIGFLIYLLICYFNSGFNSKEKEIILKVFKKKLG